MGVATRWHGLNLDVQFDRLLSSTNGLGTASLQENYSASVGKQLTRATTFSMAAIYSQSDMLTIRDPIRFSQRAFHATFTRHLSSFLDFVAFVRYTKFLTGLQDPYLQDHNQFGIQFEYLLPGRGRT